MEPYGEPLSIRVLDRVGIGRIGRFDAPTPPKFRQVLALLAFRVGQVVPMRTLIDELWPTDPPRTAVTTTQTYIYGLRRMIDELAGAGTGKDVIVTHRPGYVLDLPRSGIDVFRFRDAVDDARRDLPGDTRRAIRRLRDAAAMVPAAPLADVPHGPVLSGHAGEIAEELLSVRRTCIELEFEVGDPTTLVAELRMLVSSHPLREEFVLHLMRALRATNRRADALAAYRSLREDLDRELGLEPCSDVRRLHQEMLEAPAGPDERRPVRAVAFRGARPA